MTPAPTSVAALPLLDSLREAAVGLRERSGVQPRFGVILGTGLGALGEAIEVDAAVPFSEIPHFPTSTVEGHEGRLLLGTLDEVPVVAMQGRFHRYEGYSLAEVTFPVRVMSMLGARTLVVSGACGGMNPLFEPGSLVLLEDHIHLMGDNPLVGPNPDELGPRFPDMSEPYDARLREAASEAALGLGIRLERGVYVSVVGPNLETRAEYRMLRNLGADVVGMSVTPEVIVARHMGMRVLGIGIVTDLCLPDALAHVDIDTIIRTAEEAEPHLTALIRAVVATL